MPLAFLSPDTNEFFNTRLFGGSRTFLPKLIYEAPGMVGLPFLPSIAVLQHLIGLGLIVASGFLCANWLRSWRWWIIPFTTIMAVHPTLLWYEHFALPDSTFTCLLVVACLAGTRFYRNPGWVSFGILFGMLLLVAGARQEGFLFVAFGVAVTVRAFWKDMRRLRIFAPLALVLALAITLMTRTNQGGFMLLTSLIQWAPDKVQADPGMSPVVMSLREEFKSKWPAYPADHNASRKTIFHDIEAYVETQTKGTPREVRDRTAELCQKLAFEIAAKNFWRLPGLMLNKFRASHFEEPAPTFGPDWAHDKHLRIFFSDGAPGRQVPKEHRMMKLYLGREYTSREAMEQDLPRLYRVLPNDWLSTFQSAFYRAEYAFPVLPITVIPPQKLPAVPLLYFLTVAGFLAVVFRDRFTLSDRQLWIGTLIFQFCVIFLTGSLRSRYRLSFEPWFFLGLFCFLDAVCALFFRSPQAAATSAHPLPDPSVQSPGPMPSGDKSKSDTDRI